MYLGLLLLRSVSPLAFGAAQQVPADTQKAQPLQAVRVVESRTQQGYAGSRTSAAMRTDTPLRDTPQSVTVITRQLMTDQAMQSMADVVRYVPGVSMGSGEGHRDAPTIRGISTTADFFVDGIRDDAQYLRDIYNVERVEVLKGPDAMIFGRGGGGGVVNRVTREAAWAPSRSLILETGSFGHGRGSFDLNQPLDSQFAARVDGMFEHSGSFRNATNLERFGIAPTLAILLGQQTLVRLGYEHFSDNRRVDRGIPSYRGAPAPVALTSFFGDPAVNHASSVVDRATVSIERELSAGVRLRNRATLGDYDVFYQNTFPGAASTDGVTAAVAAYNHGIPRRSFIDVLDATYTLATGPFEHTLLAGADLARQHTSQVRRTGYFGDSATTLSVPLAAPTVTTDVIFRPSATDADNAMLTHDAAAYVQDQITFTRYLQAVAGVRFERFETSYHNNRTALDLERADRLVSPRAGIIVKPSPTLSLYSSYGISYLPSAGDQFTTLTTTTAALEPERFTNREIGAKWDARPDLAITGAVYRLERTNTSAPDPNTPGVVVQTGAQRTAGWELGVSGSVLRRWQVAAGASSQQARIVNATLAARAGATVPLVPHTSLSLWNRYQLSRAVGAGIGVVHQTDVYAAIDNAVVLPAFTRVDAALFVGLTEALRVQLNVENMLNARYFATSQGNNNIVPGAPRTLRISVSAGS